MDAREIDKTIKAAKQFVKEGTPPKPLADWTIERAKKFIEENRYQCFQVHPKNGETYDCVHGTVFDLIAKKFV